jgi:hypothetical protein
VNDFQRPLKVCKECDTPKDINCFSKSEWNRSHPTCMACVQKQRLAKRGMLGRTESQKNWCSRDFTFGNHTGKGERP